MARVTSVERLRKLTTATLDAMSREEKIELLVAGSVANYNRIRYLKKNNIFSLYVSKKEREDLSVMGKISESKAKKMTNTELERALNKASYVAKAETTYTRVAKAYNENFKAKTKVDPSTIDSETWSKLGAAMEQYPSNQVFLAYAEYGDDFLEHLEAREEAKAQGEYERQKKLDEKEELSY